MSNEITTQKANEEQKYSGLSTDHGLSLNMGFMVANTLQDAIKISEIIANSSVCPAAYKGKAGDVLVAMQMGAELGLKPMQALQNIAVINGRPSIWGDAMLAICRQSKQFEYISERYIPEKNAYVCIVKRKNEPEFQQSFDEQDAKKANLWGKQGPWTQYPKRMLQMRARGFALRDSFPDLLRGILTAEEVSDYPAEAVVDHSKAVGAIIEGQIQGATINDEQLEILKMKVAQSKSDETEICKYADIEKLEELRPESWGNIIRLLDKKINKALQDDKLKALVNNKNKEVVNANTGEVLPLAEVNVDDFFEGVEE